MNGSWTDDLRSIAGALAVPPAFLLALAVGGFAVLVTGAETDSRALTVVSCIVGATLAGIGARAIARPSRPFRVELLRQHSGMDYMNTTRRVGAFYVLAGVVWVMVALTAASS